MWAAIKGHHEAVEGLYNHGANLEAKDHSGRTVLWVAAAQGKATVISTLCRLGARTDVMSTDSNTGFRKTPHRMPLHAAVSQGKIDAVKALLKCGADPKVKDGEGKTPLDIAIEKGDKDIIHLLQAFHGS